MLCLGALAAWVWPPDSELVKKFGLLRAWPSGANLRKGHLLVASDTPELPLGCPLLCHDSLTGRGDSSCRAIYLHSA